MKRIVLVGNLYNFNGSLTFVSQLSGFEVFQVMNIEEAINLNELHRCLNNGFQMLVIKNSYFVSIWPSYSGLLNELMQKTKILRVTSSFVEKQDSPEIVYDCPSGNISICNITDVTVEIKRIFIRS